MKVFVYYNLHKHLWSIKALEGPDKGRVVHYATSVLLRDPVAKVSEAGRRTWYAGYRLPERPSPARAAG